MGEGVEQAVTLRAEEGHAVITGPGFEGRFTPAGMRFRNTLAGENAFLTYRLESARAGDLALFEPSRDSIAPEAGESSVRYVRGPGLVETYLPRPGGIEQIFEISGPLPTGTALEIRAMLESPLKPERVRGRGLRLASDAPAGRSRLKDLLTVSEPTLVDAGGRTTAGSMSIDGTELVLSFTAEQLEGARYPIRVDPLHGTSFTVAATTGNTTIRPDATLNWTGTWNLVGAGSWAAAVSDQTDTSYISTKHANSTNLVRLSCGTWTKPPGSVVTSIVVGFHHADGGARGGKTGPKAPGRPVFQEQDEGRPEEARKEAGGQVRQPRLTAAAGARGRDP